MAVWRRMVAAGVALVAVPAVAVTAPARSAAATTYTWVAGSGSYFSDSLNWSGDVAPVSFRQPRGPVIVVVSAGTEVVSVP